MIAILSDDGDLLKYFGGRAPSVEYSTLLGFVSREALNKRYSRRRRHGFSSKNDQVAFGFSFEGEGAARILKTSGDCKAERDSEGWTLVSGNKRFHVVSLGDEDPAFAPALVKAAEAAAGAIKERNEAYEAAARVSRKPLFLGAAVAVVLLLLLFISQFLSSRFQDPSAGLAEPVIVEMKQEASEQKSVEFKDALDKMPEIAKQAPAAKRAIKQDLGFLGLLGRKDLLKAAGGAPTKLKNASAGAGEGGLQGSGGEMLVGVGEGLERASVGNTGIAGLGGVGTHGAGGGAGGYGSSAIGSGEGRAIATTSQAREAALEGGLDRSVIEATIAKYVSQVRSCYEEGLQRDAKLAGEVTMSFEIGASGVLNYARVKQSSLGDAAVEGCIQKRMSSWRFPAPRGGVVVRANHPFLLRPTRI